MEKLTAEEEEASKKFLVYTITGTTTGLTQTQQESLVALLNKKIPDILSDENDLGLLEPLLKIEGVRPAPKGFDDARAKLKALYGFLEPLPDWLPWHLRGDYSLQRLTIVPKRPMNVPPFSLRFDVDAYGHSGGFGAVVKAYIKGDFVPGAYDALGATSETHDEYNIRRLMDFEDVKKIEPARVLDAIRAYLTAASSLVPQKTISIK